MEEKRKGILLFHSGIDLLCLYENKSGNLPDGGSQGGYVILMNG